MKAATFVVTLFLAVAGYAHALYIKPYSPQALNTAQKPGQRTALHFHAPWCPTCRAQESVFKGWQGDASVPGTLLVVDYDSARELRRNLGVRSQSTVIVYQGAKEIARVAGVTDPDDLRAALTATR